MIYETPFVVGRTKPAVAWFSFDPDFFVRFAAQRYPNSFVRFMQRWCLGIHWMRA